MLYALTSLAASAHEKLAASRDAVTHEKPAASRAPASSRGGPSPRRPHALALLRRSGDAVSIEHALGSGPSAHVGHARQKGSHHHHPFDDGYFSYKFSDD